MTDREKLIELLYENNVVCDQKIEGLAEDILDLIANGVTIRGTGYWEWDTEYIYRCGSCGDKVHVKEVMGQPVWDYCPACGANMLPSVPKGE